jgi:hypothetical protein
MPIVPSLLKLTTKDVAEIPTVLDLLERGRRELHQDGLPNDVVLVLELLRADLEARGSSR